MEIKPCYEHSKIGNFMFNLCAKWTKFVLKHRWLYYLMACTWGIIMTAIGLIITLILGLIKIFIPPYRWRNKCSKQRYDLCIHFEINLIDRAQKNRKYWSVFLIKIINTTLWDFCFSHLNMCVSGSQGIHEFLIVGQ